jgi:hypothetical protein
MSVTDAGRWLPQVFTRLSLFCHYLLVQTALQPVPFGESVRHTLWRPRDVKGAHTNGGDEEHPKITLIAAWRPSIVMVRRAFYVFMALPGDLF